MAVFFLAVFSTPDWSRPPLAVTAIFLIVLDSVTLWLIQHWSGNGYTWDNRHRLALVAGFLTFFVYFCFAKDFQSFKGTSIIGLAAIAGIWMLARSVVQRRKTQLSSGA